MVAKNFILANFRTIYKLIRKKLARSQDNLLGINSREIRDVKST